MQGLKMKIKRTKPGTKTSEAKHEIVKSNEVNGNAEGVALPGSEPGGKNLPPQKHPPGGAASLPPSVTGGNVPSQGPNANPGNKRASSGHRRDKARDKHATDKTTPAATVASKVMGANVTGGSGVGNAVTMSEMNGVVQRVSQVGTQRPVFPISTGPGPPMGQVAAPASPNPCAVGKVGIDGAAKTSIASSASACSSVSGEERSLSPPPKKSKLDVKVNDVLYNRPLFKPFQLNWIFLGGK